MIYCDHCNQEQLSIEVVKQAHLTVHGKNIDIQQTIAVCTICKNRVYNEILEDATMKLISDTYEKQYGTTAGEVPGEL